jgi:two-component system cell cycle sensor histidine kinase/response regulator CckA
MKSLSVARRVFFGSSEAPPWVAPNAVRMLVVDDEEPVRRYADRVLRSAGYEPILAANAEEALRLARSMDRIDALVTDLMMPEMNGDELARRLRFEQRDLKVLYLTGFCDRLFDAKNTLWDQESFLEKPCSMKSLEEAVSLLVYGRLAPPS